MAPTQAAPAAASKVKSKKRKATSDDVASSAPAPSVKKPRKAKAKRNKEEENELHDLELGINRGFAAMDSQLIADHLSAQTEDFGKDTLTALELEDLRLPAAAITDTSTFELDRTTANLPAFLEEFVESKAANPGGKDGLSYAHKAKGAPHTIIIAGAGMRAMDLVRAVRKYATKDAGIAKLFAKHIKLEEAVTWLKKNRTDIAVGTPSRLIDLLDNGALSIEHLKRLVVDASHIDQKKRGVTEMKETMIPLARWLVRPEFKDRYTDEAKPLTLMFY